MRKASQSKKEHNWQTKCICANIILAIPPVALQAIAENPGEFSLTTGFFLVSLASVEPKSVPPIQTQRTSRHRDRALVLRYTVVYHLHIDGT